MRGLIYLLGLILFVSPANAQNKKDSLVVATDSFTQVHNPAWQKDTGYIITRKDTLTVVPLHSPKRATLRSLAIPGWGQAYNKEYWKIPIIYGALGTAAGIFIYNNKWYKRTSYAYNVRVNNDTNTAHVAAIHPKLRALDAGNLQYYRNSFRRDRDYSALWFLLIWGLNVADATVFGHLKNFDVSPDLSLQVHPILQQRNSGVSLVLSLKHPKPYIFSTQ